MRMLLEHAASRAIEVRWHGDGQRAERDAILTLADAMGVPHVQDDRAVAAARSKGSAHVLAIFEKREDVLAPGRPQLALLRPREPGNAGATLRTALAFGVEDVAFLGGVDPWSPHVVRASMGAIFAMRISRLGDLASFATAGPTPWLLHAAAERTLADVPRGQFDARMVLGPEWPGFSESDLVWGQPVAIGMDERVESLNVTVAAGIALHWLVVPRGMSSGVARGASRGGVDGRGAR